MHQTVNNIYYKFIPSNVVSFDKITTGIIKMDNDIYEKYEATTEVKGELIICKDATKMKQYVKQIVQEDYATYLETIEKRDAKKDSWIYNIIDGISEQESILYKDDKCIVFLNYCWDQTNVEQLQLLCMPMDKTLRTIRSLEYKDIPLIQHMKQVTLQVIREKYNLEEGHIKMYFHYEPSTYHLHIHFTNTLLTQIASSVEYSHELNSVLFNLSVMSDYYKVVKLNIRI
jgi:m7GpppX diphosphatase